MRFAIPTAGGKLALHFGHCERFAIVDVEPDTGRIASVTESTPPPHEPGVLPRWLAEQGVNVIIAGGMGSRAQNLFTQSGIRVLVGAPAEAPEALVADFLAGRLLPGSNACDH